MNKINSKNYIMIAALIIFCILTIPKLLNHIPWFDETHAWMQAKNMNFINWAEILREEGHFIIWYLLIMPFAKLKIWFPYSLQFINWIIYFLALIIMWKKHHLIGYLKQ